MVLHGYSTLPLESSRRLTWGLLLWSPVNGLTHLRLAPGILRRLRCPEGMSVELLRASRDVAGVVAVLRNSRES